MLTRESIYVYAYVHARFIQCSAYARYLPKAPDRNYTIQYVGFDILREAKLDCVAWKVLSPFIVIYTCDSRRNCAWARCKLFSAKELFVFVDRRLAPRLLFLFSFFLFFFFFFSGSPPARSLAGFLFAAREIWFGTAISLEEGALPKLAHRSDDFLMKIVASSKLAAKFILPLDLSRLTLIAESTHDLSAAVAPGTLWNS